MRLSTAAWPQEEEPSLWVRCECKARLKGLLHCGKMGTKCFESTIAKGIQIRCLTSLLLAQRPLALFNTRTQNAFTKRWIAVRNINPQSPDTSTDWTDIVGSICILFSLVCFMLSVQSKLPWREEILLIRHWFFIPWALTALGPFFAKDSVHCNIIKALYRCSVCVIWNFFNQFSQWNP